MANTNLVIPELGDKFSDDRSDEYGSFKWSWERPISQLKYLVIHHSVTDVSATPHDIWLLHKARGWGGIGYHFVITVDGVVHYVGDTSTARANVLNMNEQVIGICLIGDFTKHLPSDAQITSAHRLCKFFLEQPAFPVNSWEQVVGHKELQATACPGDSWNKDTDGDMWWRIKTGTIYSQPPATEHEEVYKILYKGEEIARYDYNPGDKITELSGKLKTAYEDVAAKTVEVGELSNSLTLQQQDNADLTTQLAKMRTERDTAISASNSKDTTISQKDNLISTINTKIAEFEAGNPLGAYGGWELIKKGIDKLLKRR